MHTLRDVFARVLKATKNQQNSDATEASPICGYTSQARLKMPVEFRSKKIRRGNTSKCRRILPVPCLHACVPVLSLSNMVVCLNRGTSIQTPMYDNACFGGPERFPSLWETPISRFLKPLPAWLAYPGTARKAFFKAQG